MRAAETHAPRPEQEEPRELHEREGRRQPGASWTRQGPRGAAGPCQQPGVTARPAGRRMPHVVMTLLLLGEPASLGNIRPPPSSPKAPGSSDVCSIPR